jgi:hypothetical protein
VHAHPVRRGSTRQRVQVKAFAPVTLVTPAEDDRGDGTVVPSSRTGVQSRALISAEGVTTPCAGGSYDLRGARNSPFQFRIFGAVFIVVLGEPLPLPACPPACHRPALGAAIVARLNVDRVLTGQAGGRWWPSSVRALILTLRLAVERFTNESSFWSVATGRAKSPAADTVRLAVLSRRVPKPGCGGVRVEVRSRPAPTRQATGSQRCAPLLGVGLFGVVRICFVSCRDRTVSSTTI